MLFNSYDFILQFLPVVFVGFLLARRAADRRLLTWLLLAASLYFYGDWDWRFLPLLVGSIAVNFAASVGLARAKGPGRRRALLAAGVVFDLGLLFWFKYASFATTQLAAATGWSVALRGIVLPIGISFYTFQQIAYLVDVYRRETVDFDPLRYALFVSFFPQLIAGPIVHHRELIPQLPGLRHLRLLPDVCVGITIFTIGLAKKVVLADSLAKSASPVFDAAALGTHPGTLAAWVAVLAYGLQIYFDFSGYSDMAIGLGRMFGIRLPINFASPYRARSIVEFWHRWHVTLSRFLRDYLYIPLGGNRRGFRRRLANVMATMVLGGIWHGAGWTFALWGTLHGAMLVGAQAWRASRAPRVPLALSRGLTFLGVMLAWVPFRAADLATTTSIWGSLLGLHGAGGPPASVFDGLASALAVRWPGPDWAALLAVAAVAVGLGIVWLAPNTQTWLRRYEPGLPSPGYQDGIEHGARPSWRPGLRSALATGVAFALCLTMLNRASEFIYFQF